MASREPKHFLSLSVGVLTGLVLGLGIVLAAVTDRDVLAAVLIGAGLVGAFGSAERRGDFQLG